MMRPLLVLQLLALLSVANTTPLIVKRVLGDRFARDMFDQARAEAVLL